MIRLARPDDADGILEIYAPYVRDTPLTFEVEPPTPVEMAARIGDILVKFPWLVDEREGRVAGYAYASPHRARAAYRWCCEVATYVRADVRRSGVARALYARLFEILRAQGYQNAIAGIAVPNPPSIALHESLGFVAVGVYRAIGFKLGAWHDVGWWQLALQPPPVPPREPIPFGKLPR